MMFGSREGFDYGRCSACGSLSIAAIPDVLERFYPPAYYSFGERNPVEQDPGWRRWAIGVLVEASLFGRRPFAESLARRLATVPPQLEGLRGLIEAASLTSLSDPVLDVGSGAKPVRLATLRKLGFRRLLGIEPFTDADTTYQGVPVQKRFLPEVDGRFRLIMFHHSLEHVPDPAATLRAARDLLDPAGRCVVRTPIMGSELWRRYGADWVELDAPRHLVLFSRDGLERMAAAAGLELTGIAFDSGDWEFIASEQYRRDVAMFEPGSFFVDPQASGFGPQELAGFKAEARRLNKEGLAGRAAFWFRIRPPA
jgi:SAM-dependent methyltransferase